MIPQFELLIFTFEKLLIIQETRKSTKRINVSLRFTNWIIFNSYTLTTVEVISPFVTSLNNIDVKGRADHTDIG